MGGFNFLPLLSVIARVYTVTFVIEVEKTIWAFKDNSKYKFKNAE